MAAVASAFCAPAFATAGPPTDALQAMHQAFAQNDCKAALSLGRTIRDTAPQSAGGDWAWVNSVIVLCEARTGGETPKMYEEALRATMSEPSSIYVWHTRLRYEAMHDQLKAVALTIEAMAATHPEALNDLPIRAVHSLNQQMSDAGDEADQIRILKAISATYKPTAPFADTEGLRLVYARKLYDKGDKAGAAAIINGVQSFSALREISADPDFRALQNPHVDLSIAAERQYTEDAITLSQHPGSLEGVIWVAADLRSLGRYQEALAKLESVRDRMGHSDSFADYDQQQLWWWEHLAITYGELGDYDQLVKSYRSAIALAEPGHPNVNQVLDLGLQQVRFGHYQDALATLAAATADPKLRSPYGAMVFHMGHGCASKLAGHDADAAQDVAYALAHEKDGPGNTTLLLLCVGDIDGAAASILRQLDNSEQRSGALDLLSDFRPGPASSPVSPGIKRIPELKARADIKAAVAKAGGVQSFPFTRDDF